MEDELDTAIRVFKDGRCTPEQMADILFRSVMSEDQVLDLLKGVGDDGGYTRQLNQVGMLYMARVARQERTA